VVGGLVILVNLLAVLWLLLRPGGTAGQTGATAAVVSVPAAVATVPAAAGVASGAPGTQPLAVAAPAAAQEMPYVVAGSNAAGDQDVNPADNEPATSDGSAGAHTQGLQHYAEVSNELPPLRLDLHVYAAAPAERYAFINMHKVREGDTTSDGMQVMQITRDGVVLRYRNTEFLLGRE
jgi:hypothetical protein